MGRHRMSRTETIKHHRQQFGNREKTISEDAYAFVRRAAKGCNTKTRYASKNVAKQRAKSLVECGMAKNSGIYQCDICGGWHVTSHPFRKAR